MVPESIEQVLMPTGIYLHRILQTFENSDD